MRVLSPDATAEAPFKRPVECCVCKAKLEVEEADLRVLDRSNIGFRCPGCQTEQATPVSLGVAARVRAKDRSADERAEGGG